MITYAWENCQQCLDAAADMGPAVAEGECSEEEALAILAKVHAEHLKKLKKEERIMSFTSKIIYACNSPERCVYMGSYAVICTPWEGDAYISSRHTSAAAAVRRARKEGLAFRDHNPGAYGWRWEACGKSQHGWEALKLF